MIFLFCSFCKSQNIDAKKQCNLIEISLDDFYSELSSLDSEKQFKNEVDKITDGIILYRKMEGMEKAQISKFIIENDSVHANKSSKESSINIFINEKEGMFIKRNIQQIKSVENYYASCSIKSFHNEIFAFIIKKNNIVQTSFFSGKGTPFGIENKSNSYNWKFSLDLVEFAYQKIMSADR